MKKSQSYGIFTKNGRNLTSTTLFHAGFDQLSRRFDVIHSSSSQSEATTYDGCLRHLIIVC
jgi:hypothetical protein